MKTPTKYLISIIGPTAIGKTALSIKLAKHFSTAIVSADSRQCFKEMRIGTAVPSSNELKAATHYGIQHKSIHDNYNVGTFEKEAINFITQIHNTHDLAIMVGGSGLYVNAVTLGLDEFPNLPSSIREQLNLQLQTEGLNFLQNQLKILDPVSYNSIAITNPHRVIRALEICIGTGKPYSQFINKKKAIRPFKTISIGLTAARPIIYNRINKRVDIMIEEGLIDEAKALHPYKQLNALNTVGYKELFNYFEGLSTLDQAVIEIKKNTRRFAKRQLTWFKKNPETFWFDFQDPFSSIVAKIESEIKNNVI